MQATLTETPLYVQKGFGLKSEIAELLKQDYHSQVVEYLRSHDFRLEVGDLTIHLAKEFGFCYGVDRAVEYAYQTRLKFPDRRVILTGEIIHNPHVNTRLRQMGVEFLAGPYSPPKAGLTFEDITPADVVLLPAFGVTAEQFKKLREIGCIVVDTTCGSVLSVWKRVEQYAREGFTAIVHGKYYHEETKATCSRATLYPGGSYLVVRDKAEAEIVCDYIVRGGDRREFLARFASAVSPGFDPDQHLQRVGVANQTTMLSRESLEIAARFEKAMIERYGREHLEEHFRNFDTICSATQDRQDAVRELVKTQRLDLMIVIGGYNSSNTNNLAAIASRHTTTYHIEDASSIDGDTIRHKPVGLAGQGPPQEVVTPGWLPGGPVHLGLTAGASTPNNKIGETVERILAQRGYRLEEVLRKA